jgi:hypothetical protein
MSLYASAQIATERHAQLIREATNWRRRRAARHAGGSDVVHRAPAAAVYCHRAAAHTLRGAA